MVAAIKSTMKLGDAMSRKSGGQQDPTHGDFKAVLNRQLKVDADRDRHHTSKSSSMTK